MNILQMTDDISAIALDAFKRFLATFEYLDMKKRDGPKYLKTLILSTSNKFYNLVFQASPTIFKSLLNITAEYLDDKMQSQV